MSGKKYHGFFSDAISGSISGSGGSISGSGGSISGSGGSVSGSGAGPQPPGRSGSVPPRRPSPSRSEGSVLPNSGSHGELKYRKNLIWQDNALFASKAKINVFWNFFLMEWSRRGQRGEEKFQKKLILVFEVIVQPPKHTFLTFS